MARRIRRLRLASLAGSCLAAIALPLEAARAACSWVDSVTGWNGSLAWSYAHHATWSNPPDTLDGQTQDQLSATFELDLSVPGVAQGPMEGTMANFGHLDITGTVGVPGYTEHRGSGPFDAYAPPPPQVTLFLDSFACTYTFSYGPQLGANGTFSVKSGGGVNTTPGVVEPGGPSISPQIPIPALPEALTFSGQVDANAEGTPPSFTTFYVPPGPAYDSAEFLGDAQLGKASVQWAFQPEGFQQPLNDACAGAGDRSVWFLVQVGESGAASVETTGSDYGAIVSVWPMAQPCSAITTQVACGAGTASWNAEAGETYRVQIVRGSGVGGSLTALVTVPEPGAGWAAFAALLALATRRVEKR